VHFCKNGVIVSPFSTFSPDKFVLEIYFVCLGPSLRPATGQVIALKRGDMKFDVPRTQFPFINKLSPNMMTDHLEPHELPLVVNAMPTSLRSVWARPLVANTLCGPK
jgi:hypothetical protein